MVYIETYGKEIVSLLVPLIAWVLNRFFKSKAKLEFASTHQFTFIVQQPLLDAQGNQISPTQTVRTNSIIVQNSGREPATKVELVFNWKPMFLNLWPVRHFTEHLEPDGRNVLIFESLAPGEVQGCEVLSVNAELPSLITVRSTECVAQSVNMYPQRVVSNTVRRVATTLMFVGLGAAVYFAIILVQFLVIRTPLGH